MRDWSIDWNHDTFLGIPVLTIRRALTETRKRAITLNDLLDRYAELDPIDEFSWWCHFGILADIQMEIERYECK